MENEKYMKNKQIEVFNLPLMYLDKTKFYVMSENIIRLDVGGGVHKYYSNKSDLLELGKFVDRTSHNSWYSTSNKKTTIHFEIIPSVTYEPNMYFAVKNEDGTYSSPISNPILPRRGGSKRTRRLKNIKLHKSRHYKRKFNKSKKFIY
jgi:hypothetical protein